MKYCDSIYLLFFLFLLSFPLFFDIYRITAFNAVNFDNYAHYLLYVVGEGGSIPGSPTGYRFFSVLIAVPFYFILPLYKFSLLEFTNEPYLIALESLAMVSLLASVFTSWLCNLIVVNRLGGHPVFGITAALISMLFIRYAAIYSVDLTAILLIALLIYFIEYKWLFLLLLLLSVGFNEKIVFLFFLLMGARFLYGLLPTPFYVVAALSAFILYFVIRKVVILPGHEHMLDPTTYWNTIVKTFQLFFTPKSIYLNIIPIGITTLFYYWARKGLSFLTTSDSLYFTNKDIVALLGIVGIAFVTDMGFTIGRLALFCLPLYLPMAMLFFERHFMSDQTAK